jgi:hypothetical protein
METNTSEPLKTYRKVVRRCRNQGVGRSPGTSLRGTCLLLRRHPVWKWRELDPGSNVERGNLVSDVKGDPQVGGPHEW